jgi:iron complex outermembrane receptor protein
VASFVKAPFLGARPHRWYLMGAAFILPATAAAQTAPAQTAAPQGVENIVVTAQKRSQKAQDVPITITVLDAKKLHKLDVTSSDQLAQYVPAVQIALPSGRGNQPLINIRGIGLNDTNTNNAGPNGVYVDEVYQASPAGQTFQTFDLSRVEVLKGPQGTLYGRNTTGGAINYVTNKPTDDFEAMQDVQYGSFNTVTSETMINGQIAPHLDGRLAVFYDYSAGYFKDLTDGATTNGNNDLGYRGELKADVSDDLSLLFNFHGGNVNRRPDEYKQVGEEAGILGPLCSNQQILAGKCTDAFGYKAPHGFYEGYYDRTRNLYINALGGSVRADYTLGDITLTSLTAWEQSHKLHPEDTDADPYELIEINYGVRSVDFTQELHATGGGEGYHWLAGLYALNEHLKQDQPIFLEGDIGQVFGYPPLNNGNAEKARTLNGQFTESYAAFGQGDYTLFPGARLTLGGRLTYEHKQFDAFSEDSIEENNAYPPLSKLYNISENISNRAGSYRAAFDYKWLPNIMTYASVSSGFKSGGFNGGFLANDVADALAQLRPIKPEYITAYEGGLKTDFFDQRLRFNAAAFYYDYRDEQTYNLIQAPSSQGNALGPLPLTVLTNAPKATIKGAEFELDATPVQHLTTSVNLTFLDAKLGQFISQDGTGPAQNLTGTQLPNAPKFSAIFSADYAYPLPRGDVLDLSTSASYRSHQFFESSNNPLVAQAGYWLLDARLAYDTADKHWELAAIGKNLTSTKYLNFANDLTSGFYLLEEIVGPPRYVGGEVMYRY